MSPFALIDRIRAPAPDAGRAPWLCAKAYAHRGLHGPGRPENSLVAFAAAVDGGLGIELDVMLSRDGQAMVFHDDTLDRLTAEKGPLAQRTAAQLAAITLAGTGETIPALAQALAMISGRVPLLIEVKSRRDAPVEPLCRAVRRCLEGYRGPHAIIGFDPRVIRWFSGHAPATVRGLSFTDGGRANLGRRLARHLSLWHARPDFVTYDLADLPNGFATAQRARGLPLIAWTIASTQDRDKAANRADAIIAEGPGIP